MDYIYISKSTQDKFISQMSKKNLAIIDKSIIHSYKMIKKDPKNGGMIFIDKDNKKIIGLYETAHLKCYIFA